MPPGSKLQVDFFANDDQLFAAMSKQIGKQKDLETAVKKTGKAQKETADRATRATKRTTTAVTKQQRANQNLLRSVTSLAGGYLSIRAAVAGITQALREQREIEARTAQTQLGIAPARAAAARNFGRAKPGEFKAFEESIAAISKETGVAQVPLFLAASSALSARGRLSRSAALEAVALAAKVSPDEPGQIAIIAGGILDLAKIGKSQDPRANLGFLTAVGEAARVTQLSSLTKNVAPGLAGVVQAGGTLREAGALTAAMTQALADPEGRKGATAAVQLARQLQEFLPTNDVTDSTGKLIKRGTGISTLTGRISALQNDPKLFKQFFESGVSFEVKAIGAVEKLLRSADTPVAQEFAAAFAKLPAPADAAPFANELIARIERGPIANISRLDRGLKAEVEGLQAVDFESAFAGIIDENADNINAALGAPLLGRLGDRFIMFARDLDPFSGTADNLFLRSLRNQRRLLTNEVESLSDDGGSPEFALAMKRLASAERIIELLEQAREQQSVAGLRQGLNNAQAQLNTNDE